MLKRKQNKQLIYAIQNILFKCAIKSFFNNSTENHRNSVTQQLLEKWFH